MSNGTYIYPGGNTEYQEHLRKTDHLAYLFDRLHADDPDTPEVNACFSNMLKAAKKYINPKYNGHDVITLFENSLAEYSRIHEIRGFKLGLEFATHFFEAVKHPCSIGSIEAARKYEWMQGPIRMSEDNGADDGGTLPGEVKEAPADTGESDELPFPAPNGKIAATSEPSNASACFEKLREYENTGHEPYEIAKHEILITVHDDVIGAHRHLKQTSSLLYTVWDSYLQGVPSSVWNDDVSRALFRINDNSAYNVCKNYEYLLDNFLIIIDLVADVAGQLGGIADKLFDYKNDREKHRKN